ncbi:hypothetical protein PR048_016801 [Dryococelus australis]|uniref:Uncharacterized protein n=1 Tax=Dryococelus australis TaxID=614101 RepID=A0ABQ9H7T8_9NEOP|nr:hypothetical protein PR048_016801 [Dryococelus australis]
MTRHAIRMTKCVPNLKDIFSGEMAHIQCWAHNLVASRSCEFVELNRWNSWFKSAKYVAEYSDDLEFFLQKEEGSSAVAYFENLSPDSIGLQSLMENDTARQYILHMGRLLHPRHIVSDVVEHLYPAVLSRLPKQKFQKGYLMFQAQVSQLSREMKPKDVVSVLLGIQDSH